MANIGDIVTVVGLTKKGKERVKQHGDKWKILTIPNPFDILLESIQTGYLKWTGEDFEIVIPKD